MYSCIVSVLISVQMCFQLRLACTNSVHSIHVSGSGGIKGSPFVFREKGNSQKEVANPKEVKKETKGKEKEKFSGLLISKRKMDLGSNCA